MTKRIIRALPEAIKGAPTLDKECFPAASILKWRKELVTLFDFHFLLTFVATYCFEIPFALPEFFAIPSIYSNWSSIFCFIATGEMWQQNQLANLSCFYFPKA